jgi:hypothetical protein
VNAGGSAAWWGRRRRPRSQAAGTGQRRRQRQLGALGVPQGVSRGSKFGGVFKILQGQLGTHTRMRNRVTMYLSSTFLANYEAH